MRSNDRSATSGNGARRPGAAKSKATEDKKKKRDDETRRGRRFIDAPAIAEIAVEPEARRRRPSTIKARKNLIAALRAANDGDFSVAAISDGTTAMDEIARLFNSVMTKQHRMVDDLVRVSRSVGREGNMREEAKYREIFAGALDAIVIFDESGKGGTTQSGTPGDPPRALTAQRANGEQLPIESSISCLERDDARVFTLIVRDVSERVQQAEALRKQTVELEHALTARNRFFAAASHELRTPINAVLGYTTLLIDEIYGPLNEKQSEALGRTEKSTKHLLSIVNDVLDLSKIDAGKLDVTREPIIVPEVIEDLFVTLQPLADEHGSTLSIETEGEPITVQQRIFQEFEQVETTKGQAGTGLGLSISRRLTERLGGSLAVDSAEGKGSTFRLTLPLGV